MAEPGGVGVWVKYSKIMISSLMESLFSIIIEVEQILVFEDF